MLDRLAAELLKRPRTGTLPSDVLVYGAGGMGRRVVQLLTRNGVKVHAVLDRHAVASAECEGVPLLQPGTAAATPPGGTWAVVVAIHNPAHRVADVVEHLRQLGFGPVLTPVDLCDALPGALQGGFWLAPRSVYQSCEPALADLGRMFHDNASLALLRGVLGLRLGGDYAQAPLPDPHQYVPADLPRWPNPLRLIDCGAFTGDTIEAFEEAGYSIEQALCFEPDPANYQALAARLRARGTRGMALPCAVSACAQTLRFSAEGAGSSHLQADGTTMVQALGLDEAFPAFAPNLLKMDIEGAEPEALDGAMGMIARHRPGLAISVYHRPEHLWTIPLSLGRRLDGYEFFLRAHSHNSFDLVLYARPHTPARASGALQ
ncbi:FkbM family methyltransferase [Ramlibacter sp.]|uniref:FkbM family methyltransferase n=1 Tax=Ramlibacter sp. TaxID=1917967 RepID=UPI00182D98C7|nr:FkbM family methyltransferase [Ramlibacter sp.]MBA2676482.1 FkbM family methyltransferase [Ramlibacter sp.]